MPLPLSLQLITSRSKYISIIHDIFFHFKHFTDCITNKSVHGIIVSLPLESDAVRIDLNVHGQARFGGLVQILVLC